VNICAISPKLHEERKVLSKKEGHLISQSLGKAVSEVELSEAKQLGESKHQNYLEDNPLPAHLTRIELEAVDSGEAAQSPVCVWEVETPQSPESRAHYAHNPASPQSRGHTPLLSSSEAITQREDARSHRLDALTDDRIDCPALDIDRPAVDIELEGQTSSVLDLCEHLDTVNYR